MAKLGEQQPWRRGLLLALLALAHLGLWWALAGGAQRHKPPALTRQSELRLVTLTLPPTPQTPRRPVATIRQPRRSQAITQPAAAAQVEPSEVPAVTEPAHAEAAAAQPRASLLDSEATRRVLRQAGKSSLLSERAATAMGDGPPVGPEEILGRQIQQAANGDCLKGEFAGAGAGLLSLPFWALAELRGKCRR